MIAWELKGTFPMKDYVAALCRMRNGNLVPFESAPIGAEHEQQAIKLAEAWAGASIAKVEEDTWLQVTCDGKSVHSKHYGALNPWP